MIVFRDGLTANQRASELLRLANDAKKVDTRAYEFLLERVQHYINEARSK